MHEVQGTSSLALLDDERDEELDRRNAVRGHPEDGCDIHWEADFEFGCEGCGGCGTGISAEFMAGTQKLRKLFDVVFSF